MPQPATKHPSFRSVVGRQRRRAPQSLLTDPEWISQHQWQVTLHKLAGKRLDERIQAIGEAEFARRLDRYTRMQAAAHAGCRQATSAGSKPLCYWNDNGCQYPCLDRVAKEFIDE